MFVLKKRRTCPRIPLGLNRRKMISGLMHDTTVTQVIRIQVYKGQRYLLLDSLPVVNPWNTHPLQTKNNIEFLFIKKYYVL